MTTPSASPQPAQAGAAVARRRIPFGRHVFGTSSAFLIRLFMDVTIVDERKVPHAGAGIIYYNHIHWLDPVIICGQLHRYAMPLTKIEASRWPLVGWLLKGYHVIFITRGVVDRAALKATWEVLRDGDISVISPEGTRSLDGRLLTAKEGPRIRRPPGARLLADPCGCHRHHRFRWRLPARQPAARSDHCTAGRFVSAGPVETTARCACPKAGRAGRCCAR